MASIITRDELLEETLRECDVCIHLYGKIPAGAQDYRPTPGQRSTLELLRYLAVCGVAAAQSIAAGTFSGNPTWKRSAEMTFEEFPAAMEQEKAEIAAIFAGLIDEDLATKTGQYVTGESFTLGRLWMKSVLKWLTAYRMQLFLYAKASGAHEIGTINNWVGIDMPVQEPAAAE